jgi:Fic family protein
MTRKGVTLPERAGHFQKANGYSIFLPNPLQEIEIEFDHDMARLISEASMALARLDGAALILPNPDLFVAMYSRKEALLSSQIEGTQASLVDVLEFEAEVSGDETPPTPRPDIQEVLNHVEAMNHGLTRLAELPVSNRLMREIHEILMRGVRGERRRPGEFRQNQNWIGPPGSSIDEATFVPPPVPQMNAAMSELERYIHEDDRHTMVLKCGLVHYQFETIHPFADGTGRMGRLLITFLLAERGALSRPLLYLSVFLKRHKEEYYDHLMRVRTDGDYEGWLKFFLRGIRQVSAEATETVRRVLDMKEEHEKLSLRVAPGAYGPQLVSAFLRQPAMTVNAAARAVGISYVTTNKLVSTLEDLGLLVEITGSRRNRIFLYRPYIDLLGGELPPEE